MARIETTIPLGEGDGIIATASNTADERRFHRIVLPRFGYDIFLLMISVVITIPGPAILLSIGLRDNIVWK
jgi:hypothetical protein